MGWWIFFFFLRLFLFILSKLGPYSFSLYCICLNFLFFLFLFIFLFSFSLFFLTLSFCHSWLSLKWSWSTDCMLTLPMACNLCFTLKVLLSLKHFLWSCVEWPSHLYWNVDFSLCWALIFISSVFHTFLLIISP